MVDVIAAVIDFVHRHIRRARIFRRGKRRSNVEGPSPARSGGGSLADGRVLLELKTPWSDGTTHLVYEPLDFLAKLAALI